MKKFIKWLLNKYNLNDGSVFILATQDDIEAKRLTKALDMANCLWELEHNSWRKYKHEEPTTDFVTAYKEIINELFEEYNINTEELTQ